MLKFGITALVSVIVSCGGFWSYDRFINSPAESGSEPLSMEFSPVKSDFISIAVFNSERVVGYVTFRAIVDLKKEDTITEAGYVIADLLHRKQASFSKVFDGGGSRNSLASFEAPLLEALRTALGKDEVGALKLTDFAYDRRL